MAFVFADRVQESSTTIGLIDFVLDGAQLGFTTFQLAIGDTNSCYYTIVHDTDGSWEVGLGIVSGATLIRDTVLSSSNGGAKVAFAGGAKTVFSPATAQAFEQRLTEADHAAIDHQVGVTGVPGPETFTEADHNDPGFTHAGLPGVPGPETFTVAEHNDPGFTHAGLPGIPVISAPAPATYNVNRVSTTTTVDLTSATDGIHYISVDALGTDFDILQVDIPSSPTDDTPFLVIFNEDVNAKGAVLAVSNGGPQPLIFLSAREGCRLWHMGALDTEWQVERITPTNGHPAEVLSVWQGDTNVADDWYRVGSVDFTGANLVSRDPYQTDILVMSPTRYLAMSFQSTGTGVGDTNLAIEDDTPSILETPVLPGGVTTANSIPIDFETAPNESAAAVDSTSIGLRYSSGGDKFSTMVFAYGLSRTGGLNLCFAGAYTTTARYMWAAGRITVNTDPPQSGRELVVTADGVIDRLAVITDLNGEFDLTVYINGGAAVTVTVVTTADTARMVQLGLDAVPVLAGSRVSVRYENIVSSAGGLRVTLRLRNPRGAFIQFGGAIQPAVMAASNDTYGAPEQSFIAPLPLRLLDWGWHGENMDNNDYFELRRNGSIIFQSEIDLGFGGTNIRNNVEQLGGFPIAAGDVLTITLNGFSGDNIHLIRATAAPLVIT
jgi:hypothetical protein